MVTKYSRLVPAGMIPAGICTEPMNSITGRSTGMLIASSSAPNIPPISEDM